MNMKKITSISLLQVMGIRRSFSTNSHVVYTFAVLLIYLAGEYPVSTTSDSLFQTTSETPYINEENLKNILNCKAETFNLEDVIFLNDGDIFLLTENVTVRSYDYQQRDGKLFVWHNSIDKWKNKVATNCDGGFIYDSHEFQTFPNCSVLLYGDILLPGEYIFKNDTLFTCIIDSPEGNNSTSTETLLSKVSRVIGIIGSVLTIIALTIHLSIFCYVPALRNFPAYNFASFSVAAIFASLFFVIRQKVRTTGLFCVILGVLQLNFSLAAFFCMNVIAFDIWRTMRLGTQKFKFGSSKFRKRQFLLYLLYAWGFPLIISFASVLLDKIDGVPETIKPYFGQRDICWMTKNLALIVFFVIPACTLFIVNALFFIHSAILIAKNSMKSTNEEQKQAIKYNYLLYLKLGIIMGLSSLTTVFGVVFQNDIVWLIHDLLNSFQGLFLFLLFTCTKRVWKHLREK